MRQIIVIGLGNFGSTLAMTLTEKKCDVLAVDIDKELVQKVKEKISNVVVADAADRDVLGELGVDGADAVVVSLGDRTALSSMVTLYLKELGARKIIVKTTSDDHSKVLKLVGAHDVIFPEKDEAIRLASTLSVSNNVLDYMKLSDDCSLIEMVATEKMIGSTLVELDLRRKYQIVIIGIKKMQDASLNIVPSPHYRICPDDRLIILGKNEDLEKLKL